MDIPPVAKKLAYPVATTLELWGGLKELLLPRFLVEKNHCLKLAV